MNSSCSAIYLASVDIPIFSPLFSFTSVYTPIGLYLELVFDVVVGIFSVFVCLTPVEFEVYLALLALVAVGPVVAVEAPWGNETPGTSSKSCLRRLEDGPATGESLDLEMQEVVVVESLVFCKVFAACNCLDMIECNGSLEQLDW